MLGGRQERTGKMSDSENSMSDSKKRKGDQEYFHKSKKTQRTPTKAKMEVTYADNEANTTEICKQLLIEVRNLRKEQSELKQSLEMNNEEIKALRDDIKILNTKWEKKYEEMENKFRKLEVKVENLEKEKRKNNIVITGMEMKENGKEVEKQVQEWINKELGVNSRIKETRKITQNKVLITMANFEEKMEVMRNKNKLKGKRVYIDSDLTPQEINIQRKLRLEAKKMREEGKIVKMGHLTLIIDGKRLTWSEDDNKLVEKGPKN